MIWSSSKYWRWDRRSLKIVHEKFVINDKQIRSIRVCGKNPYRQFYSNVRVEWVMGYNSIHFLDFLKFLFNSRCNYDNFVNYWKQSWLNFITDDKFSILSNAYYEWRRYFMRNAFYVTSTKYINWSAHCLNIGNFISSFPTNKKSTFIKTNSLFNKYLVFLTVCPFLWLLTRSRGI